jgi:hypothetical protein
MDYVGTVSISSTAQVGDVLFSLALSPLLVPATRLQLEASQWERYAPREWEFLLSSMHGTTFDGQVIAFVDPDPVDTWTNTPLNINKAAAQFNAQPDNVWKNFETCLPIVPGVPDFYTNPLNTSDARFTQAGVLRIIYTGGCIFPSGVTSYQLFNVYQWVDVRFSQPELELSAATTSVGQAKTTTPTRTNLLNGASVSSAIPVTITPTGADIDTGNLGGNNLVVELAATANNLSDVAASFGIDLGVSGAIDSVQQVVRLAEKDLGGFSAEAVSQYLFSGDQSWSITPQAFGLPNVQIPSAVMNLFPVPMTITSIAEAQKMTRLRRIKADPKAVPAGATTCSSRIVTGSAVQGEYCFATIVTSGTSVGLGFDPVMFGTEMDVNGTTYHVLRVTWIPSGDDEILDVVQNVSYSEPNPSTGLNIADTLPSSGVTYLGTADVVPLNGGTTQGQLRRCRYRSTGTGQCVVNLLDVQATPASGSTTIWGAGLHLTVYPLNGVTAPKLADIEEVPASCRDRIRPQLQRQNSEEFYEVEAAPRKATIVARRHL